MVSENEDYGEFEQGTLLYWSGIIEVQGSLKALWSN